MLFKCKERSLPIQTLSASYIVDMDNQRELVGLVDYVSVSEVLGVNENIYGETEEDVKTVYWYVKKVNIADLLKDDTT